MSMRSLSLSTAIITAGHAITNLPERKDLVTAANITRLKVIPILCFIAVINKVIEPESPERPYTTLDAADGKEWYD
jgi:hypothetical protein